MRRSAPPSSVRRALYRLRHRPRQMGLTARLKSRTLMYRLLSDHHNVFTDAQTTGAILAVGAGTISCRGASLGYWPSPGALDGCVYLEARTVGSLLEIGEGSTLNNRCTLISEGPGISIGRDVVVGPDCMIFDSDFHHVDSARRGSVTQKMAPVLIGDRVFIGARAIILKGVTIADDAVVAAGAVVTRDVQPGQVVAGNPATVIGVAQRGSDQPTS